MNELPDGFPEGRFTDLRFAGSGSEGRVWRAHDRELNGPVAIKEYLGGTGRAFYQELRVIASLDHPSLLQHFDFYDLGGKKYIVWEFCAGGTLRYVLESATDFPVRRLLCVGRQIAGALAALHAAGVVHGDVKPDNILRRRNTGPEEWKLGDFGISSFASAALQPRFGTEAYRAPEVITGRRGMPSDIYSFGRTLAECLERSGTAANRGEVAAMEAVWALGLAMTAEDPSVRPTAAQVLSALNAIEARLAAAPFRDDGPIPDSQSLGWLDAWVAGGAAVA